MKDVAWVKWVSKFDMEDLVGSILRRGTVLSVVLVLAGLALRRVGLGGAGFEDRLQGTNVLQFLLADAQHIASLARWPAVLVHGGLAALFLTPYARVLASLFYFASLERSWRQTLLTACTLLPLTYILFLG